MCVICCANQVGATTHTHTHRGSVDLSNTITVD